MTNNDILRQLRYTFNISDQGMIDLFSNGKLPVNRTEISDWLKKENDMAAIALTDVQLAAFLNGFILFKRGPGNKEMHHLKMC